MKFIFIGITFLLTLNIYAQEMIQLNDKSEKYLIGNYLEYYEDSNNSFAIEDIRKSENSNHLFKSSKHVPNFLITNSVYWIRFTLQNASSDNKDWFLELAYPFYDSIEIYCFNNNILTEQKISGNYVYPDKREIHHFNYVFSFNLNPTQKYQFYMRIRNSNIMTFPLFIYSFKEYFQESQKDFILYTLFFTMLLMMMLYNIFLLISLKDICYFYFILFLASILMMQVSLSGFGYLYFWPSNVNFHSSSFFLFNFLLLLFCLLFSTRYLNTKEQNPWIYKINMGLVTFTLLVLIFFLSDFIIWKSYPHYMGRFAYFLNTAVFVTTMITAVNSYQKGFKPAKLLIVSWSINILFLLLFNLMSYDILPIRYFLDNFQIIGITVEVILIFLGLTFRSNLLKKEKERLGVIEKSGIRQKKLEVSGDKIEDICRKYQITQREKEVLIYFIKGQKDLEIAKNLYISSTTVRKHINNISQKMGVSSRVNLLNQIIEETD